jgi:hypothetical protein
MQNVSLSRIIAFSPINTISFNYTAPTSEDLNKSKLHRSIQARLRLPIISRNKSPDSPIVGINALIPLRSSELPSWKTITLPVTVQGNPVEGFFYIPL